MKIVIPYRPRYPDAHRAIEAARFSVLVAHRRFGKTVMAINHIIKKALSETKPDGHYIYVAPLLKQAKKAAWKYLLKYTAPFRNREVNKSELSVTIPSACDTSTISILGADNPDGLRGTYYDGVILDEVAQMKPGVWEEVIRPALADRLGWAFFIGTPKGINLFSEIYYRATNEQAAGNKNWVALCYPIDKSHSLPKEEVEEMRKELSENAFRQELLCDFSASSDDVLITLDEARASLEAKPDKELARKWPLIIGVDIARFGDDATVFFARQGLLTMAPLILRGKTNTEVAHKLIAMIDELGPQFVNIDQGQGTGVIDILRDAVGAGVLVSEVPFGSRALNAEKYYNRRAEMWCLLRDWLRLGGCLPECSASEQLIGDLTAPQYFFDPQGRIRLEAKDEIKRRLARSTDLGDALALTFAVNVQSRMRKVDEWQKRAKAKRLKEYMA